MINTFLAALVATFFWGKSTKDVEEKTQLSSWTRTIVYGVLAIAVWAFYLKTNQVATVSKNIQIMDVRRCIDSNKNVIDTVAKIELRNIFSQDLIENKLGYSKLSSTQKDSIKRTSSQGGLYIVQNYFNKTDCKIETIDEFKNELCQLDKHTIIPIDSLSHVYQVSYFSTSIPSLVPLSPKFLVEYDSYPFGNKEAMLTMIYSDYESYPYEKKFVVETRDSHGRNNKGDVQPKGTVESTVYTAVLYSSIKNEEVYHCQYSNEDNFTNKLNFFTAADVSQYTCFIRLKSKCYIKELDLYYDLPIEINPYDSCMSVGSHNITVRGSYINDKDGDVQLGFHVKFPTLANLQLVRSLILTTLLTALVSMFFLNLFYRIRKHAINFKEKHITQISDVRVKSFKIKMYIILYILLIILCYISWRIFKDNPFHLDIDYVDWIFYYHNWIIAGLVIILALTVYFLFRKAYTIEKKKKK